MQRCTSAVGLVYRKARAAQILGLAYRRRLANDDVTTRRAAPNESNASVLEALFLDGVDFCGEASYAVVLDYEREAAVLGYPVLA